ncbi:MAG: DUF3313 domain-containing protein, partial [Sphingomicrobium sp.]
STGVLEVSVDAPDVQVGRTDTYSDIAGDATLVIEARDSLTGSLLGRAIDQDIAGDYTMGPRNRATNRGDFRDLVQQWAKDAVRGMDELKRLSPVP